MPATIWEIGGRNERPRIDSQRAGFDNRSMPYTLVLLRHGESTWNLENRFTGWHDVPLSETGLKEGAEAGRLMAEAGLRFDVVHTSLLRRAIQTVNLALDAMDQH